MMRILNDRYSDIVDKFWGNRKRKIIIIGECYEIFDSRLKRRIGDSRRVYLNRLASDL